MFKALAFCLIFLVIIPVGSLLASHNMRVRTFAFVGMLFFTCWMQMIHIAPMPLWTGTARGFALSMVDIFACIVLGGTWLDSRSKRVFFPAGSWAYFLYMFMIILSVVNAMWVPQWGFEVVKMFWMFIFFLAAYNFLLNSRNLWSVIYSICGIVIFMFLYGLYQKYIKGGYYQIPSTMPHQNSLSLYIAVCGAVILGVLLNEKISKAQMVLLSFTSVAGIALSIFTYSRGGLICYAGGLGLVTIGSVFLNGLTSRKVGFILTGAIVGGILLMIAAPRIIHRFERAPEASKNTRIFLALAATRMANQFKLGVGANNFSEYSGPGNEYAAEMFASVRVTDETPHSGGIVETIYLLVAAECGWGGLVALLVWFWYYYIMALRGVFALRKRPCFGMILGIFCGLTSNYIQSTMEWSLKQYGNFYLTMLMFALIAVIWKSRNSIPAPPKKVVQA